MFKELMPVLRNRAILMTLALVDDDKIRVTIIPKKIKEDENAALTTPVMITGTAEELEADLGKTLVSYTGSHLQLKNTLQNAQAEMDAAAKAAKASASQAKSKVPLKKEGVTATRDKAPEPTATVPSPRREPSKPAGLFDMPDAMTAEEMLAPTSGAVESEEEDILAEIDEEEDEAEGEEDRAA